MIVKFYKYLVPASAPFVSLMNVYQSENCFNYGCAISAFVSACIIAMFATTAFFLEFSNKFGGRNV